MGSIANKLGSTEHQLWRACSRLNREVWRSINIACRFVAAGPRQEHAGIARSAPLRAGLQPDIDDRDTGLSARSPFPLHHKAHDPNRAVFRARPFGR
jgi:hypothetical protein